MKQRLFIFGSLLLLVLVMIGLNAVSYVQKTSEPDSELMPNRSSYNPGSTGTKAFYSLLEESGRNVRRWQLPIESLNVKDDNTPATFVVIGPLKRRFTDGEYLSLQTWVSAGGRLLVIDREPDDGLLRTTTEWLLGVTPIPNTLEAVSVDPADQVQMTDGTPAVEPSQVSWLTVGVNAIQPSRLASAVEFERLEPDYYDEGSGDDHGDPPPKKVISGSGLDLFNQSALPSATPIPMPSVKTSTTEQTSSTTVNIDTTDEDSESQDPSVELSLPRFEAPVSHFSSRDKDLVVEVKYGNGLIVYVADPFIVANGGINMADNVQFALNLAGSGNIVFDELHHGFGSGNNRVLEYFRGTPVVGIVLQILAIVGVVVYSSSRRFARFVPEPEPDRLTKLEYVEAMADIQRRTKAYDLAIENIYTDFKRRSSRLFGLGDPSMPRYELAAKIAERTGHEVDYVESLMAKCEDVIHGEQISRSEVMTLAAGLRTLEEKMKLSRKPRTWI